jgi:hypothetical protein
MSTEPATVPHESPHADPKARPVKVRSDPEYDALVRALGEVVELDEDPAFAVAAGLHATLEARLKNLADETWGALDYVQRRYGYSYRQLSTWLGWSPEGTRKRLVEFRARHGIEYTPQTGDYTPPGR